jgi:uncharacterized membrane protein
MGKNRLEAFSDGVLAIIITIMVLELKRPNGPDLSALTPLAPVLSSYVLSFIYIGIYWNNHHHLFHATKRVNGAVLWANLHLLFWLSLFPVSTEWMGSTGVLPGPTAAYGFVLFMAGLAYYILQSLIIADEGASSLVKAAVGHDWKGKLSPLIYLAGIAVSWVNPWIAVAGYVFVALMWLVPDRRIERLFREHQEGR